MTMDEFILRYINQEIEGLTEKVLAGSCESFPDYRERVGAYRALVRLQSEIEAARKREREADGD